MAGFSAFVTVAITVPLVFSSGAGATASPHHYGTPVTVCSTTTTLGATAVSGITTPVTVADVGQQGVVQLGVTPAGNFVTLPVAARAAAGQLPRTGSSTVPVALGGLTLLVAGALALTTKRRPRQLGVINPESRERS